MILNEQAIPCVLHMENRVGEKMLQLLLIDGANERDCDKAALNKMISAVNDTVNTKILGTRCQRSNWKVHMTKEGTIAEQPMTNNHTRKIINGFDYLVTVCVKDDNRREQWLECVDLWREIVETVRQNEDFADEQIKVFQHLCDIFSKSGLTSMDVMELAITSI